MAVDYFWQADFKFLIDFKLKIRLEIWLQNIGKVVLWQKAVGVAQT